jgi:hypothetical protein
MLYKVKRKSGDYLRFLDGIGKWKRIHEAVALIIQLNAS